MQILPALLLVHISDLAAMKTTARLLTRTACLKTLGSSAHLAEVLLHELRPDDADEGGGCVVGDRLGQHRLAGARDAVQQDAAGRVDADLLVQLVVRQRQLHRLPDLLLLDVQPANVLQVGGSRVSIRHYQLWRACRHEPHAVSMIG